MEVDILAWIKEENRFLNRKERQERIDLLEAYIQKIKKNLGVEDLSTIEDETLLLELYEIAKELKRLKRVHRAEVDLLYFSWEYFSETANPENQGNWDGFDLQVPEDAAKFHKEICEIMDEVSNKKKNKKVVVAAPRGHAKSTYLSKAFPLREIVFRKRTYIIMLSITPTVTEQNLDWLKLQLKHNKKLREDFGPILSPKKQENPRDNNESFITSIKLKRGRKILSLVEASSEGKPIRGRNWNSTRPDLIICDDLEDQHINAGSKEQREKLKEWYNKNVEFLGDPKGKRTAFVYMGTMVAPDCLLQDLIENRSDYEARIYRAIERFPKRMDLWLECEEIYHNPDKNKKERAQEAYEFYLDRKELMDEGAEVLWEEVKPIWELFKTKWDMGSRSFSTEYMNNPIDKESQIFDPDKFTYYDPNNFNFLDEHFYIVFGVDFAMGKKDRGDYSSLTILAKSKRTGTRYVVESIIDKMHPDDFINMIVQKVVQYQPDRIAADSNASQEFLTFTLKQRLRNIGYPSLTRVKEIKDRTKKELRIEALAPDILNGHIQFNKRHYLLIEQFAEFPNGSHDDGPDSLSMAESIARKTRAEIIQKPWYM